LNDKIVNGHHFKTGRKYSWPAQMTKEDISVLEVVWYETETLKAIPTAVEGQVLQKNFLDENEDYQDGMWLLIHFHDK
jgi:hypothetical protein